MQSTHLRRTACVVTVLVLAACSPAEDADRTAVAEEAAVGETMGGEASAGETPDVERPKNFMLIEFSAPIQEADLTWLEENGFHVDTVFSETTLRGWLEVPEGGEVIGTDPRVARIDAMMR